MPPTVPPELLLIIVDMLEADFAALRNLGLVSKFFRRPTRAYLFERLDLVIGDKSVANTPALRLLEVLRSQPYISTLVNEVAVRRVGHASIDDSGHDPIIAILSKLPAVTQLALMEGDCHLLPSAHMAALHRMMTSPRLQHLKLYDLENIEIGRLIHIKAETLEISRCRIALTPYPFPSIIESASKPYRGLSYIIVVACGPIVQALLQDDDQLHLSHLTRLTIGTLAHDAAMIEACTSLLARCSRTLQTYWLAYMPDNPLSPSDCSALIPFSNLPKLEEFALILWGGYELRPEDQVPHQALVEEFGRIAQTGSSCSLKSIAFAHEFHFTTSQSSDQVADCILRITEQAYLWKQFDDVLAHAAFSALQKVTLSIAVGWQPHPSLVGWAQAQAHISESFKRVSKRGVSVQVIVRNFTKLQPSEEKIATSFSVAAEENS